MTILVFVVLLCLYIVVSLIAVVVGNLYPVGSWELWNPPVND